jgi:hypothetical protein
MWMNEMEIEDAAHRWRPDDNYHPVMTPATLTLAGLVDAVNRCSDGWPYWKAPGRAAQQLMDLIMAHEHWERSQYRHPREGAEATPDKLRRAYTQLLRFRTGRERVGGIEFRIYPADGVTNADPRARDLPQPAQVEVEIEITDAGTLRHLRGTFPPGRKYVGTVTEVQA